MKNSLNKDAAQAKREGYGSIARNLDVFSNSLVFQAVGAADDAACELRDKVERDPECFPDLRRIWGYCEFSKQGCDKRATHAGPGMLDAGMFDECNACSSGLVNVAIGQCKPLLASHTDFCNSLKTAQALGSDSGVRNDQITIAEIAEVV